MTAPYIPTRDALLDAWGSNFDTLISADPALYGLQPSDATAIDVAYTDFHNAYLVISVPANRSQVTIATKNNLKATFVQLARTYAQQIRNNPGVSNDDKLALGLNLANNTPSPIPAPSSQPLISFKSATPLQHELRYSDYNSPASRKKAPGSIQVQWYMRFSAIGSPPPSNPFPADAVLVSTKNPTMVNFDSAQAGLNVTYWARFVNRNGLFGPWSDSTTQLVLGS